MASAKFTKLELQIMQALWDHGPIPIREIHEAFPERDKPSYTTIQTTVYRLEGKNAVRRVKKISNAHIFEAVVSRSAAQRSLIDELLGLFGGRTQPMMAHPGGIRQANAGRRQGSGESLKETLARGKGAMIPDHLWQSTLFAGLTALLALALRNNQARTRYWLWLIASAKFLVPFSLLVAMGQHIEWSSAPKAQKLTVVVGQISQPFTQKQPIAVMPPHHPLGL